MRNLGFTGSALWSGVDSGYLSAPITAHFNLTRRCLKGCENCYVSASSDAVDLLSTAQAKTIIDELAKMSVLTVAFGGGEPFLREDIFEIARYAQQKGIRATATTNGWHITPDIADKCGVFDHIHVSADLGDGGVEPEERVWHGAIELLRGSGIPAGINFIVDSRGFGNLERLFRYGDKNDVRQIMLLRFKAHGRAKTKYDDYKLSQAQNIGFYPLVKRLAKRYGIRPMVDCSFLPMICFHRPKKKSLEFFGAEGCRGGDHIAEIDADGLIRCCSFCEDYAGKAAEVEQLWSNSPHFRRYRDWIKRAPEPCRSCDYLELCRGGCHCVALALAGDIMAADPECPLVAAYLVSSRKTGVATKTTRCLSKI